MTLSLDLQLSGLFQDLYAFYGTLSPNGSILSLDGNIFKKTSIEPEVLVGQKFSDAVFWQSSEQDVELINNAVSVAADGKKSRALLNFRVNSTIKKMVELNFYPISGKDAIFFCAQDITQKEKEIEFHKMRSEQILYAAESAEIGLWFWDVVDDKIFSTPRFNDFFEVPAHDLIDLDSFFKVLHPEDRERVELSFKESQISGKEYREEFRVINSDGNTHWLSARGKSFLDAEGNPVSMMGMVRKITDRKIADEELSKIYERERKARDEAEDANRAKDFFLAFVSHELRSPLNAILGWTKILLTKEVDEDTRKNALETIERSARSQSKLINDLVDSARVASGKLRLELRPLNFYEVIKNVYNSTKPQAEHKNIRLDFSANKESINVVGDVVRLQQVFTNLLSNSLKFTPEGGQINISVESSGDIVKIYVRDNGQGINEDTFPNIFNQFSQGDMNNHDRTGLGLGLSIVKTLIGKHGGTVTAESEGLGKGSTFTVTLPLSAAAVKPIENGAKILENGKPLKGKKILIVEDDPDSCEVLDLFLEQSGAEVVQSMSASEAMTTLKNLKNNLPDVIISDLGMSEEDGYSLMKRIRAMNRDEGGTIPAIALSAFTSQDNKKKAYEVGFQKYHTKPFEPDLLINEVLDLLN
ncbi:hypothetical protein BH20ACI4_BH20ACI4_04940 [soil metagenome]